MPRPKRFVPSAESEVVDAFEHDFNTPPPASLHSVPDNARLYCGNLNSDETTPLDLYEIFKVYGEIVETVVLGTYGFVQFNSEDVCAKAADCEASRLLHGNKLELGVSKNRPKYTDGKKQNNGKNGLSKSPNFSNGRFRNNRTKRSRSPYRRSRSPVGRNRRFESPQRRSRGRDSDRYSSDYDRDSRISPKEARKNSYCQLIIMGIVDRRYVMFVEDAIKQSNIPVALHPTDGSESIGETVMGMVAAGSHAILFVEKIHQMKQTITLQLFNQGTYNEYNDIPLADAINIMKPDFQKRSQFSSSIPVLSSQIPMIPGMGQHSQFVQPTMNNGYTDHQTIPSNAFNYNYHGANANPAHPASFPERSDYARTTSSTSYPQMAGTSSQPEMMSLLKGMPAKNDLFSLLGSLQNQQNLFVDGSIPKQNGSTNFNLIPNGNMSGTSNLFNSFLPTTNQSNPLPNLSNSLPGQDLYNPSAFGSQLSNAQFGSLTELLQNLQGKTNVPKVPTDPRLNQQMFPPACPPLNLLSK